MSRRWLVPLIVTVAIVLVAGRVLSSWYVDYNWFAINGATRLWWVKAINLSVLRVVAFLCAGTFAFLNLFAVRSSVRSLRMPRRIGNLEFSEEVSARILNRSVLAVSIVIGIVFALTHNDWLSLDLMRHGLPYGETDPYFRLDLGTWLYQMALETTWHTWSMVVLIVMTVLVVFLYVLTPSLRWESGQLHVSGHVRRHLSVLAGVLLLLLAWGYRLDAFDLLREGTGPAGALSALDHKLVMPANLTLAMLAVASAMLVTFTGWIGQTRVAFVTITIMLLAALTVRQALPAIGGRFVTSADADAQEQSYRGIRNAYTRRAYGVDAIERATLADAAPPLADALRGASLWDREAMRRVVSGTQPGARPNGALGWHAQDGRLVAFALEQPIGPESVESLPAWGINRVAADVTDDRGGPVAREDAITGAAPRGVLVHDSATTYYVLSDTGQRVVARTLDSFVSRLAHAWHLQNPALLGRAPGAPARLLLHRDVRERVTQLYPFFAQGKRVTPIVWRDSVYWAVHLYSASDWYPLSAPQHLGGEEVRTVQHAGVAIVNGHTGRVSTITSPRAGPMAESWMLRFPELFSDPSMFDMSFLTRLPPPADGVVIVAHALASSGMRGEFEARAHLPGQLADSLYTPVDPAPWFNRRTNAMSVVIPLLDPTDEVRGVVIAQGGPDFRIRFTRGDSGGPRWSQIATDLQAVSDSFQGGERATRPLAGALRILPTTEGFVALQTQYIVRPDGIPQVLLATIETRQGARTGRTLIEAAGLPNPVVVEQPVGPGDFRKRVATLYESMREAMRKGDWAALGAAYDALGRLLRSPPQP